MAKVSFQLDEDLEETLDEQNVVEEPSSANSANSKPKIGFFKGLTMSKKEKEALLSQDPNADISDDLPGNEKQNAPLSDKEKASQSKKEKKLAKKQKRENAKLDKKNSKQKSIEQRAMIKAHRSLLDKSTEDMSAEEITHYYEAKMRKETFKLRVKRIITLIVIALFVFGTLFFGIYNAYLKPEKSVAQVATEVNQFNRTSAFPENGLDAFLQDNLQAIFEKKVNSIEDGSPPTIAKPRINLVAKRSNELANVYFSAEVSNSQGTARHNFVLPVAYNFETNGYSPAGDLAFSPNSITDSTTETENDVLSFEEIPRVNDNRVVSDAQVFVNNFFVMVYNEKLDTRNSYTGLELAQDEHIEFVKITKFDYYQGYNENGYNAYVEYSLKLDNGITYDTSSYLDLRPAGDNSFTINAIL